MIICFRGRKYLILMMRQNQNIIESTLQNSIKNMFIKNNNKELNNKNL